MDDETIAEAARMLGVCPIKLPDGGTILYVPADPARRRIHVGRTSIEAPEVSTEQFAAWMTAQNLDAAAAAAQLTEMTGVNYTREVVYQFRKGSRPVPARVRAVLAPLVGEPATALRRMFGN